MFACEGGKLRLRCNKPRVLRIYAANYGRTEPGASICPHVNISSTECRTSAALMTVTKICANRARCKVWATDSVFSGNPCPGTFKYLDVIYGCGEYIRPIYSFTRATIWRHSFTGTFLSTVPDEHLNLKYEFNLLTRMGREVSAAYTSFMVLT